MPVLLLSVTFEYFNPVFVNDPFRNAFYFLHPIVFLFGKGDFNINKLAKNNLQVVRADAKVAAAAKRYKF